MTKETKELKKSLIAIQEALEDRVCTIEEHAKIGDALYCIDRHIKALEEINPHNTDDSI